MKTPLQPKHLIRSIFLLLLLCSSYYSFTNATGAPSGNTNAPGDGNCTSCHSGSLITSGTNWNNLTITTNVPANGYVPGSSYTITISHTVAGINKWGFEFLALNGTSFVQAGSLTVGSGMQALVSGGKTYLTHNSGGTTGSGSKSWSFTWTAPNPGVGAVNFYAVVNAANGDGSNSGDQIYAKTIGVTEFTNLPTAVIDGIPASTNVCLGDTLSLLGSGINSPTTYAWTFTGITNPTLQSQQNPRVVFTGIGQKTITLTTSNSFGSSTTTTKFVNVINKPSAIVSPAGTVNICGNDSTTLSTPFNSLNNYLWSPNNETTSSIKSISPGVYKVTVTNTSTGCAATSANVTLVAASKPIPVLTLSKDSICSADSLTLSSSSPFTTYKFFDNNTLLQSGVNTSYKNKFASGNRNIGLVVVGSNGCNSDTVRKVAFVQSLLQAPVLTCGNKTTSSVSFNWAAVAGASGYEVSVDTGKTWTTPSGILTHTIAGLSPNTNAQLWVRAIDAALCSRGNTGTLICTNGACNSIGYKLTFNKKVCLQSATDSAIIPITITVFGNSSSHYVRFGNGAYTSILPYQAKAFLGDNILSMKILDSLNIGCPRVDTIIHFEGINPISKRPVMGVQGALCSSDSALHTFTVSNANSGADYFNLFRNSDSIPFKKIQQVSGDTAIVSILRKLSPVNSGDTLYAVAVDTVTGCAKPSLPYNAIVYTSPKSGFTTTANFLEVTFTDTTAKTAKRDWLFFGAIPNELNGAKSITKTFPTHGDKTVMLMMTDSNGCSDKNTTTISIFNTGINVIHAAEGFSIYPNPVHEQLSIILSNNQLATVKIFDMKGSLVLENNFSNEVFKVDVTDLINGLYFVEIIQNNNIHCSKFTKE